MPLYNQKHTSDLVRFPPPQLAVHSDHSVVSHLKSLEPNSNLAQVNIVVEQTNATRAPRTSQVSLWHHIHSELLW